MTKIGLIGGIGPESTIAYYRQIVNGVQSELGPKVFPRLSIETLNPFQVFSFCKEERYEDLAAYVLEAIDNLASSGAKFAALTGNTPNIVYDKLQARSRIPLISAISATVEAAQARGVTKVGLLGTVFTMTNSFFKRPFEDAGIEVVVPEAEQIAYIQTKIETELEHGIVKDETRSRFIEIIEQMKAKGGIQQIILGCTELPLLLDDGASPVPCLDTMQIHVAALVKTIAD
ncbi:aspartate racemase [Variovorax sp. HW608]|uniref:aspartate/glutamate racemase family protein n=1 Tax=Variovorax sp. HW608 TaxID=1034889 RepID=UPI00081FC86B|nr:amino acid racemase [Variovorax sp. HW608]SCK10096.1 aspartate racemase [Variovorax sp. HW608]